VQKLSPQRQISNGKINPCKPVPSSMHATARQTTTLTLNNHSNTNIKTKTNMTKPTEVDPTQPKITGMFTATTRGTKQAKKKKNKKDRKLAM